jgi:hypothetical protein
MTLVKLSKGHNQKRFYFLDYIMIITAILSISLLVYGICFYKEKRPDPKTLYLTTTEGIVVRQCNFPVLYSINEKVPLDLTDIIIDSFEYWNNFARSDIFKFMGILDFTNDGIDESPIIVVEIEENNDAEHANAIAYTSIKWKSDGCIKMSAGINIRKGALKDCSIDGLKSSLRHEVGHLLGFKHSKFKSDLMYNNINPNKLKDLSEWELKAFKLYYYNNIE